MSSCEYKNQLLAGKLIRYKKDGKLLEEGYIYADTSSIAKTKHILKMLTTKIYILLGIKILYKEPIFYRMIITIARIQSNMPNTTIHSTTKF